VASKVRITKERFDSRSNSNQFQRSSSFDLHNVPDGHFPTFSKFDLAVNTNEAIGNQAFGFAAVHHHARELEHLREIDRPVTDAQLVHP